MKSCLNSWPGQFVPLPSPLGNYWLWRGEEQDLHKVNREVLFKEIGLYITCMKSGQALKMRVGPWIMFSLSTGITEGFWNPWLSLHDNSQPHKGKKKQDTLGKRCIFNLREGIKTRSGIVAEESILFLPEVKGQPWVWQMLRLEGQTGQIWSLYLTYRQKATEGCSARIWNSQDPCFGSWEYLEMNALWLP